MAERLTEFVTKNCSEPFYRFNENSHISVRYRYCANISNKQTRQTRRYTRKVWY